MSNYIMQVDFFGNSVRCESDGLMVSLNDLVIAGNAWRVHNGQPYRRLEDITKTKQFGNYKTEVCLELGCEESQVYKVVRGGQGRTMAHLLIALYVAEEMSSRFRLKVIKTFMEGKLLEFRELGGTEFKTLNAAIDLYLPGREGKDNKGVYITAAKLLRTKLLGADAKTEDWGKATVSQTHARYDHERRLSDMLSLGLVRDFDHLKELIGRL